jgi:hypothetical protein
LSFRDESQRGVRPHEAPRGLDNRTTEWNITGTDAPDDGTVPEFTENLAVSNANMRHRDQERFLGTMASSVLRAMAGRLRLRSGVTSWPVEPAHTEDLP